MGRFDAVVTGTKPTTQNRFGTTAVGAVSNRFANLDSKNTIQTSTPSVAQPSSSSLFGGFVGALGKILTAPQAFTTGLAEKGLEKKGVLKTSENTPVTAVKNQESNIDLLRRVGSETGKGGLLTGQYTPTEHVFGNFVRELPVTTIGTLGDIFADPLTYVGGVGLVKRTTQATGKLVAEVAKTASQEIPAVQKVGDILGRAFISRYGQSEEFKALDRARKVGESAGLENVHKIVSPIIEKPAVVQQRITQIIKGLDPSESDLKILAQPIREELDRIGESISKLNPKLLSEDTFQANKGSYFPRLYTDHEFPAGEQGLIDNAFSPRAVSVPKAPFKGRTLTEEESLAKGTRIEEAGLPALKRLSQLTVVEERQKFFKEVAKSASDNPLPGHIQLPDDKALGDLSGKFLPAPEYRAIAEIRKIPSGVEQNYLKALSLWKTFKTAYNPATIARNDLTNFFILNPLGGVGPHRLDLYARATNELLTKGPLYQLARKEGLEISTQQAAELTNKATRFYKENNSLVKPFFDKVGGFHNAVKDFYGSQDKYFKMANFIKGVTEEGMTPTEAMRRANFYLVDYSEVPELISFLRKSPIGAPFISFAYGVTKPLAKTLVEHPEKLANYYKILRGVQEMNPYGETPQDLQKEKNVLPDWISNGSYLRIPHRDVLGRSQYVDLEYILPLNVIEAKSITPNNPLLSITASLLMNKDSFTGKELYGKTDSQLQKTEKLTTYALSQLLPSFTPFVGTSYNKLINSFQGRPDRSGFVKSKAEVLLDILGGIKVTPIDATIEAQKRASEKESIIQDLRSQLKIILLDKSLFPEEKQRKTQEIQKKIRETVSPTGATLENQGQAKQP